MNGKELGEKLDGLTKAQLRIVWTAAVREMGMTTKRALQEIEFEHDGSPRGMCFEFLWHLYCAKRVYTGTGKFESYCSDKTFGTMRKVEVQTCSWAESDAAIARIFAAAAT